MDERRAANQSLAAIRGGVGDDAAAEAEARVRIIQSQREAFRKCPDTPLKEVLSRKLVTGRKYLAICPLK